MHYISLYWGSVNVIFLDPEFFLFISNILLTARDDCTPRPFTYALLPPIHKE